MVARQPPRFYGITIYQDPQGRFSLRHPSTWQEFDIEGKDGKMYLPDVADPATNLSIWLTELEHTAVADDLDDLKAAVDEGISRLDGSAVEASTEMALGNLLKFERIFAFQDGEATRKRKTWMLYVDKWLMVLTWQGSTVEEYDYWFAMANYSFHTFVIPEALWFATDRDLVGYSRS